MEVRVACFGDVVGSPGRKILGRLLPGFIRDREVHLVVVNGENMAGGSGITEATYREIREAGADVVTSGDHIFKRSEVISLMERDPALLRPANYPKRAAGRGHVVATARNGVEIGVINLVGRVFMGPAECPFLAAQDLVDRISQRTPMIFVDMHAEATSEKIAMGWFLDGRVSAVFGTHTHVQTADEAVLPGGTGYLTDLGMTGPHEGVLGRKVKPVLHRFLTNMPASFKEASEWVLAKGALFTVDHATGRCLSVERVVLSDPGAGPTKVGGGFR